MIRMQSFVSLDSRDIDAYGLWIAGDSRVEFTMANDPHVCVRITWDDKELRLDQRVARVLPGGIQARFAICGDGAQGRSLKCVIRLEDA